MMRTALLLAFAAVAACKPAPPPISDGPPPQSDASDLVYDDGATSAPEAGDANDAGADAPDGAPIADTTAACDPAKSWAAGAAVSAPSAPSELAAINGSATTLAWVTTSDDMIHYADRDDTNSPWGAEQTLTSGFEPGERPALTGNALALYAVGDDGRSLVSFERAQIGDAFVETSSSTLDNLNAELASLPNGASVSDVVMNGSGTLLLLRWVGGPNAGLRSSRRVTVTDTWPPTTPFAVQAETQVVSGKARRPTGISVDGRALFYWDETTGSEKVGFFAWDATTMTQFADLGARAHAQVDTDCSTLYFDDGAGHVESAPHQ